VHTNSVALTSTASYADLLDVTKGKYLLTPPPSSNLDTSFAPENGEVYYGSFTVTNYDRAHVPVTMLGFPTITNVAISAGDSEYEYPNQLVVNSTTNPAPTATTVTSFNNTNVVVDPEYRLFYGKNTCGQRDYFKNVLIDPSIDVHWTNENGTTIISSRPYNQQQAQRIIANQAQSLRGFQFPTRVHFDLDNCGSKASITPVAPDAPVIFISSQTAESVTISWLYGFDGGSPITSQGSPPGNPIWGYTIYVNGTLHTSIAPKPCLNSYTLTFSPGDQICVTASNCVPNTQYMNFSFDADCTTLTSEYSNCVTPVVTSTFAKAVAVGQGDTGTISYYDGTSWTYSTSGSNLFPSGAGGASAIGYSPLTLTWIAGGQGDNTTIIRSSNGINWTPSTTSPDIGVSCIAFGSSRWVLGGQGPTTNVAYSDDNGNTWTPSTSGTSVFGNQMNWVAYNATTGLWVGVGANNVNVVIAYSTNGNTGWTPAAIPSGTTILNSVATDGNALWVAVGNQFLYSPNGTTWNTGTNNSDIIQANSVAYGLNADGPLWVATGTPSPNPLAWSTDGINWNSSTSFPGEFGLNDGGAVSYNTSLSLWIAGNENGVIVQSSDGKNWILSAVVFDGPDSAVNGIASANPVVTATFAKAVAVGQGDGGSISYYDGTSWTYSTSGGSGIAIGYSPLTLTWIAGGQGDTTIIRSSNGIDWTPSTTSPDTFVNCIAFGSSRWVLGGQQPCNVSYSDDNGDTWNPSTSGTSVFGVAVLGVAYNATTGLWVGVGFSDPSGLGVIAYSPNGNTGWTPATIPSGTEAVSSVATDGNALWVAAGGTFLYSPNGTTWYPGTNNSDIVPNSVAYGSNADGPLWVATGEGPNPSSNPLAWSTDGITWNSSTTFPSEFNGQGQGVSYNTSLSLWIAGDDNGVIVQSSDGKVWSLPVTVFDGPDSQVTGIASANPVVTATFAKAVAVGQGDTGTISYYDGTSWTYSTSGSNLFNDIASAIGYSPLTLTWIAGGVGDNINTAIIRSSNGIDWTPSTNSPDTGVNCIAFGSSRWVLGGQQPCNVSYSDDNGDTWNTSTSGTSVFGFAVLGVAYNAITGLWVGVGFSNPSSVGVIAYSPNGNTGWTLATIPSGTEAVSSVATDGNALWVAAGGTFLHSPNGTTWYPGTNNSDIVPNSVAYGSNADGPLWVATGEGPNPSSNPLAWSTDGITWNSSTSFPIEFSNAGDAVSYNTSLSLWFAGDNDNGVIVQSTDGKVWTLSAIVFDGPDSAVSGIASANMPTPNILTVNGSIAHEGPIYLNTSGTLISPQPATPPPYGYTVYKFNPTNTTSVTVTPNNPFTATYLIVGGGGGGGGFGGGGGAGGLRTGTVPVHSMPYNVTVGGGGSSNINGADSAFDSITANGGGYGGYNTDDGGVVTGTDGGNGGSGGGAAADVGSGPVTTSGSTISPPSQGTNGGSSGDASGGGGGGAGGAGGDGGGDNTGGTGGVGLQYDITGTPTHYAGGGGGSGSFSSPGGSGGLGGGGDGGGYEGTTPGTNGTPGTGGGGGANTTYNTTQGGSGIVVLRFPTYNPF
jgi:hypothetical protein